MLIDGVKKAKSYLGMHIVTLGMHIVKYGCDLLGPGTLKFTSFQLKNESMNWADFLHAGSDVINFG